MVIEWLQINVVPPLREHYIQKDTEIWTAFLSRYPGFLGKEIWINPDNVAELIIVIRWATREAWKSIPEAALQEVNRQFNEAIGSGNHQLVASAEYQVRKFPQ
ncbi:TIGR03792 family protein [Oculatella sp. LEGE 06141]|uniref:TIGR03792 family protein n=1 Tax=Oculatella sp. LEGE 06141 TaxID=1828648 RepID=UPI001881E200|nr:TIGR03792 family protein [Oculatella sp. LEGE 06141]MBE9177550.1 TIGR03792 family protein [Oculatella sp. LEGE 06141]